MKELRAFTQLDVAAEAAPAVTSEGFALFGRAERGISFHPDRVEVHIAAQFQKVAVRVHQQGFVAPLKKMAAAVVVAVEINGISRVEPLHEAVQISLRRVDHEMKVVGHQDVAVDLDPINRATFRQNVQELAPVGIIRKDVPAFVAPGSDVLPGAGVLDPQRAGH